jgi:hypothetical protein
MRAGTFGGGGGVWVPSCHGGGLHKLKDFANIQNLSFWCTSATNSVSLQSYQNVNFSFQFLLAFNIRSFCCCCGELLTVCLNWKLYSFLLILSITFQIVSSFRVVDVVVPCHTICHTRISLDLFRLHCANVTASWTVGNVFNELEVSKNRPHFCSFSYIGPRKMWALVYFVQVHIFQK